MKTQLHDACEICGATQQERPLIQAHFAGEAIHLCVACMPKACQGHDFHGLAERLREQRSQDLNTRPLDKPGLRY
jgi:ribosome-binding protein aMBF1 (putative translation factor)